MINCCSSFSSVTHSSNVSLISSLSKFMLFILGLEAINTGGIESFSPPLGEDLLAQLANNIIIIIYTTKMKKMPTQKSNTNNREN